MIKMFTKTAELLKLKKSAEGWYQLEKKDAEHMKNFSAYILASIDTAKNASRLEALNRLNDENI